MSSFFHRLERVWKGKALSKYLFMNKMIGSASSNHLPNISTSESDKKKASKGQRLQDVMWKPEEEFPGNTTITNSFTRETQVLGRITKVTIEKVFKPRRLALLGACSTGVLGITSYEASLLLNPSCDFFDSAHFMYKYSMENFFASCIWETCPPELVAQAMGLPPEQILNQMTDSPEDAALKLKLLSIYTTRSIVAGFMVIAQLLSIASETLKASTTYRENVYSGKEPPLEGVYERIIRLAGDGSDATEVSMSRYGEHILPVYETPEKYRHLVSKWSLFGRVPCIWHVAAGQYGYRHSWAQLHIDASYMLRTTTGKSILCIEADATNLDAAHNLKRAHDDITLEDASQAYRMIERAASKQIPRPFRTLCVFLGDSYQLCDTGGTSYVTLRERIRLKKEVDVFIDAKAPLLIEILKWCGRFVDKRNTIVLDATPQNYIPLQILLESKGYQVLDPSQAKLFQEKEMEAIKVATLKAAAILSSEGISVSSSPSSKSTNPNNNSSNNSTPESKKNPNMSSATPSSDGPTTTGTSHSSSGITTSNSRSSSGATTTKPKISPSEKFKPEKLPRLIYYPTTASTINAVHSILTTGDANPRHCCVLINSPFGLSHLKEIAEYEREQFHPICAAEIYDDYFRQVRIWTRMGHSSKVIQEELDRRFAEVYEIQQKVEFQHEPQNKE
jgi:hypothetical protein